MPRAKGGNKTEGAPFWYSDRLVLSDEQKRKLCDDHLGFDWDDVDEREEARSAITSIECCLGTYQEMVKSTDKAPRPTTYVNELSRLRNKADALLQETDVSYWMQDTLNAEGYDIDNLSLELAKFIDVSTSLIKKNEGGKRQGADKKDARRILLNTLHRYFQKHYQTPPIENKIEGYDSRKRDGETESLLSFLGYCLKIIGVEPPSDIISQLYNEKTPAIERLYLSQR